MAAQGLGPNPKALVGLVLELAHMAHVQAHEAYAAARKAGKADAKPYPCKRVSWYEGYIKRTCLDGGIDPATLVSKWLTLVTDPSGAMTDKGKPKRIVTEEGDVERALRYLQSKGKVYFRGQYGYGWGPDPNPGGSAEDAGKLVAAGLAALKAAGLVKATGKPKPVAKPDPEPEPDIDADADDDLLGD